ncbi:MAG TPA: hypothetical protein VKQ71_07530, partial [Acidimicrobiales bacterium]|nr:hypothetical protein [Acidimicrobiales bacterium]
DLFSALGGYDPVIGVLGEDLNLSWRAQLAGARVVVAPEARVRHLEALASGRRVGWTDQGARMRASALADEHRVRTILTCYGPFHLLRVAPQAILLTACQAIVELLSGRVRAARASVAVWPRALRHAGDLWATRRAVQSQRTVPDAEVRRLQTRGSARVRDYLRARVGRDRLVSDRPGAAVAESLRTGSWRLPAGAWAVVAVVVAFGSRGLLRHHLPGVGSLPVLTGGPARWWHLWVSGWRPDGLGSAAPAPPALALLSLGGTVLFGATGFLQHLLVLGPFILGPLGAYRAARPLGSRRGRVAALIVYAAVPVPYNALAGGRWAGLVLYAVAPWLLAGMFRASGEAPFPSGNGRVARLAGLGLLVAATSAFVPATLAVVPFIGLAVLAGSLLSGRVVGGMRTAVAAGAATAVAVVLLLPWSADVLGTRTTLFGVRLGAAHRLGLGTVVRFHTGPVGGGPLAWGIVAAAALPLLIGQSWRLVWATRLWAVALACWGVTWAASRGSLPIPMPVPEILLAPAAAALAAAVALGAVAFEVDLPGYRFGWRQVVSALAAAAVVIGSLPVLGAASGGRWHLPSRSLADPLGSLAEGTAGSFRVLWVGDPQALPVGAWWLEDGVGYATSESGTPDVTGAWPARSSGATPLLATDLRLARAGLTTRLGHLMAPMAVRYIVVPNRAGPADSGASRLPTPTDIVTALSLQVDLRTVSNDPAVTVYENASWTPERSVLAPAAVDDSGSATPQAAQDAPLAGDPTVFSGTGHDRFAGPVPGGDLLVSATRNRRWVLSVSGRHASQRSAFGWAMAFSVPDPGGNATLRFHTPVTRGLALGLETLLWLVALAAAIAGRRRAPRRPPEPAGSAGDAFADRRDPVIGEPSLVGALRRPRRVAPPVGIDPGDEDWL